MRGGITSALGAQPGRTRYSRRDRPTLGGMKLTGILNLGTFTFATIPVSGIALGSTIAVTDSLSPVIGSVVTGTNSGLTTPCIATYNGSSWIVTALGASQSPVQYTTTARDALSSPSNGQLIFNTTQSNLNTYNSSLGAWDAVIDSNVVTRVSTITQAAYNALSPPASTTLYIITDAVTVGPAIAQIVNKTGDYTITSSDYCVNVTANTCTITLPSAIGLAGYIFIIKNSGAGTVTVTGSETIDGAATAVLAAGSKASITVQSTGTNYIIT